MYMYIYIYIYICIYILYIYNEYCISSPQKRSDNKRF